MRLLKQFIKEVKNRTLPNTDSYFKVNALVGELGEYSNLLKKQKYYELFEDFRNRVDKEIKEGKRKTWIERETDELGDILFYFIQLINDRNISIEEIIKNQLQKLKNNDIIYGKTFIK